MKINNLPIAEMVNDDDVFPVVQDGETKKVRKKDILVQSDMNVNDESDPAFIKNRTHWKEKVEVDYTTLPYLEPIQGVGLAPYGKRLGLEMNKTYTIEVEVEGQIHTLEAATTEMPKDIFGVVVPDVVYLYQKDLGLKLLDGIDGDFTTSTITGTDNCFYNFDDFLPQIKIYGIQGVDTITHKIPDEFINFPEIDQVFNSKSENAQSGIAVEQSIKEYDKSLMVNTEKIEDGSITLSKMQRFTENVDKKYSSVTFSIFKHQFGKSVTSGIVCLKGLYIDLTNCNTDTIDLLFKFGAESQIIPIDVSAIRSGSTQARLNIICAFETMGRSLNYSYYSVRIEVNGFLDTAFLPYQRIYLKESIGGTCFSEVEIYALSGIKTLPITPYDGIIVSSKEGDLIYENF